MHRTILHTRHFAYDLDAFAEERPPAKPPWWNPDLEPCDCEHKHAKIIQSHEMPSDGALWLVECQLCHGKWCSYFEG